MDENNLNSLVSLLSGLSSNSQNNQNLGNDSPDLSNIIQNVMGALQSNNINTDNLGKETANFQAVSPELTQNSTDFSGILNNLSSFLSNSNYDDKTNLLIAAKPFLGDSFMPHIDHGVKIVSLAKKIKVMLGTMGTSL